MAVAKSSISSLITKIKRRADYNITDTGTDNLIVDMLNDAIKRVRQKLLDIGMFDDISASTTLTTVADTAYVDVSTIVDLDEIVVQSDRTADRSIMLITYDKFIQLYPDPTACTSNTPIHAARWNSRIYFGPTPSEVLTLYFDYIKQLDEVTSSSTSPFEPKYDPLLIAMVVTEFKQWLGLDSLQIQSAMAREKTLDDEIFLGATNIGVIRASQSRRGIDTLGPHIPSNPIIGYEGYGLGFYGGGEYGR